MGQPINSADILVLLGEMVEMASGYADQCEESLEHDDAFLLRLAYDELFYLRKRVAKLDEKLLDLEERIRAKAKPSRPQKRTQRQRSSERFKTSLQLVGAGQKPGGRLINNRQATNNCS
jgi:hypothetical protein